MPENQVSQQNFKNVVFLSGQNSHTNSRLSTLIQLLFSFDQDMGVEKTLIQTLACQLSSTLIQLLFLFDQDMELRKLSYKLSLVISHATLVLV